jgi:hypothetical protein
MRWGKARQQAVRARDVVREADRLLQGRTVESYISRRERVPAWSLIGLLGHGSRVDLLRLAAPSSRSDPGGWSGTVARLAGDLVRRTADDRALVRLQRLCLVPLELSLLAGSTAPPCTPAELFDMVTGLLERPLSTEF